MSATDAVGSVIDALLERRYGAEFSEKWWQRYHDHAHRRCVMLACPFCPDALELGRQMLLGTALPMSYNDAVAARKAVSDSQRNAEGAVA